MLNLCLTVYFYVVRKDKAYHITSHIIEPPLLRADKFVLKFVLNKSIGKGSMHFRKKHYVDERGN